MATQPFLLYDPTDIWIEVKDGNASGRALFRRHYSYAPYRDGRDPALFVGPGEKLVLLTPDARALFVWRKFISGDGQKGVNCAVFRNEGAGLASDLIRAADRIAWDRWPGERHYTYVNPKKLRSRNPGCCFLKARLEALRSDEVERAADLRAVSGARRRCIIPDMVNFPLTVNGSVRIFSHPQDAQNSPTSAFNMEWSSDNACVSVNPNTSTGSFDANIVGVSVGVANVTISGTANNAPPDPSTNPVKSTTFQVTVNPGGLDHFAPATT